MFNDNPATPRTPRTPPATALDGTVAALCAAVQLRDPYTAAHQLRVAALTQRIAETIGLPRDDIATIVVAARLHDIGKLGCPADILASPRRLLAPEYELVKMHAAAGRDIVAHLGSDAPIAAMIGQHHERLDGCGYPDGLRGDEILLGARIIAVADVVEAMASHRPYRAALGVAAALRTVSDGRGHLFDPVVADACLELFHNSTYYL